MLVGLLFATLVSLCGLTVTRVLRAPLSLAPLAGLASVAVLTSWAAFLELPPFFSTGAVLVVAAPGALAARGRWRAALGCARRHRVELGLTLLGAAVPAALLGAAFAGIEAPVSTHDGAWHVELVDRLRAGQPLQTWYPIGFHASVAAVLGMVPWWDSARGTLEAAQGLAILAPLGVWSLGLALGLHGRVAACAAVILGLTWSYPYDYHLWAGWPQGMGVLLVVGLCATALHWIRQPSRGLALLAGLFAAAILLSHGTEVYSSALVLSVVALASWRSLDVRRLVRHAPLAVLVAVALTGPYLLTLLGWAGGGGATAAGEAVVSSPDANGPGDWFQLLLGITGSGSALDLPLRASLIGLGLTRQRRRLTAALWLTFVVLVVLVDQLQAGPIRRLFVLTYPWLDHDRPIEVAVAFAGLLAAGGLGAGAGWLAALRTRMASHPAAWRRGAMACALGLLFFAEGSGVSVYKRLTQAIAEQNVYSADAAAAMGWLRQHAQPGALVANDLSADAGIWAPYKAHVSILLPRSASGSVVEARQPILDSLLDLQSRPSLAGEACALRVEYLFHGAAPQAFDERTFPDRAALEQAPALEEVFSSGDAAVFRLKLPCGSQTSGEGG